MQVRKVNICVACILVCESVASHPGGRRTKTEINFHGCLFYTLLCSLGTADSPCCGVRGLTGSLCLNLELKRA